MLWKVSRKKVLKRELEGLPSIAKTEMYTYYHQPTSIKSSSWKWVWFHIGKISAEIHFLQTSLCWRELLNGMTHIPHTKKLLIHKNCNQSNWFQVEMFYMTLSSYHDLQSTSWFLCDPWLIFWSSMGIKQRKNTLECKIFDIKKILKRYKSRKFTWMGSNMI